MITQYMFYVVKCFSREVMLPSNQIMKFENRSLQKHILLLSKHDVLGLTSSSINPDMETDTYSKSKHD